VQRLIAEFGDSVNTKAGKEPDDTRHIPELLCKLYTRRKNSKAPSARLNSRVRVVTLGLDKLILPTFKEETAVLKQVVDYVSQLRVTASLFANWVQLRQLSQGQLVCNIYDDTNNIFSKALTTCYGGSQGKKFKELFRVFSEVTGIPLHGAPMTNINQILSYQATEMKTAASNMDELNFTGRVQSIVKYVLHKTVRNSGVSEKVLCRRIHDLAVLIVEQASEQQVKAKFASYGFIQWLPHLNEFCRMIRDDIPDATRKGEYPARVRFLWLLQRDYVEADRTVYNEVVEMSHELYPDTDDDSLSKDARKELNQVQSKKRATYIKSNWALRSPPKLTLPLPLCKREAAFIRIDQKAIIQMFPKYQDACHGAWWYRAIMNPYSKEANIACLRQHQNSYGSSEMGMLEVLRSPLDKQCPWLVGSSFMTNGLEAKLTLVTSSYENPGAPGLWSINKKGWRAVSSKVTPLDEVLNRGDGVYQCHHVSLKKYALPLEAIEVVGIDPGQVKIVSGVRCKMSEAVQSNVSELMNANTRRHFEYTGEEYEEKSRAKLAKNGEKMRRAVNPDYAAALRSLSIRKKTGELLVFEQYCKVWSTVSNDIWKEKLNKHRSRQRFSRFRAVQSAIASVAERISPMREKGVVKRLVFFGTGSLTACRGAGGSPTKKVVRECCQRVPTLMTLEAYSTMKCPGCRRETRAGDDYRTRTCETLPSNHGGCPLHPDTHTLSFDRDMAGETNITVSGVSLVKTGRGKAPTFASLQPLDFQT
jgi:hypothetical protein